ncbi:MAG: recombinase family protein, partial [Mangrovibacterium sp.]
MIHLSLKTRLSAGFGLLLFLVILLGLTATYFIYELSNRSDAMLSENYQTVESAKYMIQSIDEIKNEQLASLFSKDHRPNNRLYRENLNLFSKNLDAAQHNITEEGEAERIRMLENNFQTYLAVYDSLRLTQPVSPAGFQRLISTYSSSRNAIIDIWDGIDTGGALGGFLMTILGAVAELERENIVERVKSGLQAAKNR